MTSTSDDPCQPYFEALASNGEPATALGTWTPEEAYDKYQTCLVEVAKAEHLAALNNVPMLSVGLALLIGLALGYVAGNLTARSPRVNARVRTTNLEPNDAPQHQSFKPPVPGRLPIAQRPDYTGEFVG